MLFGETDPRRHKFLTIRRILEGVRAKNLEATMLFVDFSQAFDSIHRGKMEQIILAYSLPKETVAAIMTQTQKCLNASLILKKMDVSFIVHFCLVKYNFSRCTF